MTDGGSITAYRNTTVKFRRTAWFSVSQLYGRCPRHPFAFALAAYDYISYLTLFPRSSYRPINGDYVMLAGLGVQHESVEGYLGESEMRYKMMRAGCNTEAWHSGVVWGVG